MAKVKVSKDAGKFPNKALHSRISYLYQAATYLATQQKQHSKAAIEPSKNEGSGWQSHDAAGMTETEMRTPFDSDASLQPASRRLISDLRTVSLKAQIRMSPAIKYSTCKNCDTLLIDGSTCTSQVDNTSKRGKKPWADILVRRCNTCGTAKRFPVAAERQKRRPRRSADSSEKIQDTKAAGSWDWNDQSTQGSGQIKLKWLLTGWYLRSLRLDTSTCLICLTRTVYNQVYNQNGQYPRKEMHVNIEYQLSSFWNQWQLSEELAKFMSVISNTWSGFSSQAHFSEMGRNGRLHDCMSSPRQETEVYHIGIAGNVRDCNSILESSAFGVFAFLPAPPVSVMLVRIKISSSQHNHLFSQHENWWE
jgi:ribonuclease P protein subunit RPR2